MKIKKKQLLPQLKMMKIKTLLFLLALLFIFNPTLAFAQTEPVSTNSAEQTTKNLKTRIEKVVQEKREQIKGVIEKIYQTKRGFIGIVERISEDNITIRNSSGVQILAISDQATILKNNREINLDDIAIENWVVVMGIQEQDSFQVRRLLVSEDSLRPNEFFVSLGSVIETKTNSITINPRNQDEQIEYDLNSKTAYQDNTGEEIKLKQINEESQVLIVGYKTEDGNTATSIRSLSIISNEE